MEQQNLTHLNTLLGMLEQGQFVEGMEAFFAPDVTIQEVGQAPKTGRDLTIAVEKELLEGVSEFIQYRAHTIGAGGDKTFYEATMEFKTTDGQHVVQNQAVVTTWQDGKIVDERYYHGNV
ncbi:MAG: nuclear transport factor 2 family protein [Alphaproteobacteria bacterium]|jgi:ketosteroid isomerase-like protein|nr:nuclear transport factor 2 family protein [Henriciella sp.]MBO6694970.1 nuclear transport factor 2 family protein [Henriciella sp.]MCH9751322.1 nuclear transport factor 2 family protein [Alphaproteobacteria bacterium]